jgi:AcrR family transcriptional regulator
MVSPTPEPRRRPGAEETRRRLIAAGLRAFAAHGLEGTNLREDILEKAGVSVGSFYHQFPDKTGLLLAILDEYGTRSRERLHALHAPRPGRSAVDVARDSFAFVLEMAEREEDLVRIQLRVRSSDDARVQTFERESRERWRASLAEDYTRISAAGGVAIEAELLADLMIGLSLGVVAQYLETPPAGRRAARERLLDGLVRFTLGGAASFLQPNAPVSTHPTDTQE